MRVVIVEKGDQGDDWTVWVTLPGHNPLIDTFGFCIGGGTTREAATADAYLELTTAASRLITGGADAMRDPR